MRRALLTTAVAVLLAFSVRPVAGEPAEWTILGYHVVRPGETLFCIGRAYGVSPWAIATQNGIINPNLIHPGLSLAIPDVYVTLPFGPVCTPQFDGTPTGPCACASHYTIVRGDTLFRISVTFGVSMWRIAECNGIGNPNYIRAADTLCIPETESPATPVPPAPTPTATS